MPRDPFRHPVNPSGSRALNLRKRTWAYLAGVALAAILTLAFWWRAAPEPLPANLDLIALFVALAVAAQHWPLPVGPQRKVDASIAVYFAALLLFGPPVAVALVGVAQLLGQGTLALRRNPATGRRLRTVPDVLFNASQLVLAVGLGGLAYAAFLPPRAPAPPGRVENLWALPAAAATIYLVNSLAVAVIAGLQLGRSPLRVWLTNRRSYTLEFIGLFLCGLVTAIATLQVPWAPLAMVPLVAILFLSLRRTLGLLAGERELRVEAQAASEKLRQLQGAVERERALLTAVMASMSDGLVVLDRAGAVRYCNARAACLLDLDPAAVVGQDALALLRSRGPALARPDEAIARWGRLVAPAGEPATAEIALAGPAPRDLLVSAFPICAGGDASRGLLLRDITVPKQLALLEERERIAMDLHDGVIQALYGVGLALSARERAPEPDPAGTRDDLRRAIDQVDEIIRQIRNTIFDLRPAEPGEGGLGAGLTGLVRDLQVNGLRTSQLELDPAAERLLDPEAAANVLQIAREATANIIRHAAASEATIRLVRTDGRLTLTISDNGKGFEPRRTGVAGQGLRNMTERARMLRGQLAVESMPWRGTEVRLDLPLDTQR